MEPLKLKIGAKINKYQHITDQHKIYIAYPLSFHYGSKSFREVSLQQSL
jgi:hypothetical protein